MSLNPASIVVLAFVLVLTAKLVGYLIDLSNRPRTRQVTSKDLLRYASYLKGFNYYTRLSPEGKLKFMSRLVEFMLDKKWEGWEGLTLDEEKKVLISASAIQLTFGIEHYVFAHFHTIRVYPKAYYYKLTDQYFKGGTSVSGVISLSWRHFVEGYNDPDDKLNLGLHEWAHALKIDLASEDDFDSQFLHYFENWEAISYPEFKKMHEGEPSFLRAYAGTNMHEFFAVCVEHFFEVPRQFKEYLPVIYRHLSLLLNQDPANIGDDYRLTGSERHPKHARQVYAEPAVAAVTPKPLQFDKVKIIKQGFREWPMYIVALGLFGGMFTIFYLGPYTVLSTGLTILYILAFGAAGMLLWPYFKRRGMLEFRHFIMYSFCGQGMCLMALMLVLNYYVPISAPYDRVEVIEKQELYDGMYEITVHSSDMPTLRTGDPWPGTDRVRVTVVRGLLGIEVIKDVGFVD
jgi:MtfA peptidase